MALWAKHIVVTQNRNLGFKSQTGNFISRDNKYFNKKLPDPNGTLADE